MVCDRRIHYFRSQMIRGWQETNLPLCDDQFHRARFTFHAGSNVAEHGPVEIHDCKIVHDSLNASKNLSTDLSFADVVFTHCAVFYNGGPIVLVPVKMARTHFKTLRNVIMKQAI